MEVPLWQLICLLVHWNRILNNIQDNDGLRLFAYVRRTKCKSLCDLIFCCCFLFIPIYLFLSVSMKYGNKMQIARHFRIFHCTTHKSTHRSDFQNSLTQHHPNDLLQTLFVCVCMRVLMIQPPCIPFPFLPVCSTVISIEFVNVDGFYIIRWCRIIHKYTRAHTHAFICRSYVMHIHTFNSVVLYLLTCWVNE